MQSAVDWQVLYVWIILQYKLDNELHYFVWHFFDRVCNDVEDDDDDDDNDDIRSNNGHDDDDDDDGDVYDIIDSGFVTWHSL